MNDASVLFSEAGLAMQRPEQDILFLEDFVYTAGLPGGIFDRGELCARSGAQGPRLRGMQLAGAESNSIPENTRNLAVSNLHFYIESAGEDDAVFCGASDRVLRRPTAIGPTNPSIARQGDEIVLVQRTVNYTIDHAFRRAMTDATRRPNGAPIHTRNFLLRLDRDLAIRSSTEILPPADMPEARLAAWSKGSKICGLSCGATDCGASLACAN